MCEELKLEQWQSRCLENLFALGDTILTVIIHVDRASVRNVRDPILFRAYSRLFVRPRERQVSNDHALPSDVPVVTCRLTRDGSSEYFTVEDVEKINGYNNDFILSFSRVHPSGELLSAARHGIWSFQNNHRRKIGSAEFAREMYNDDTVTHATLNRLTGRDKDGIVLREGYLKTVRDSYSKNIDRVLNECARWPAQVCVDLRNGNLGSVDADPTVSENEAFQPLSNLETCLFPFKLTKRRLAGIYRLLFRYTVWNVGIVESPIHSFLAEGFKPEIKWLPQSNRAHIQADPFGRAEGDSVQVLFEKLDYRNRKGVICTIEVKDGTPFPESRLVMELPVHMSYPYLLEYNGESYCIPETNRAREVSLYKAVTFPYKWTKVACLLENVRAIDTTVFQYDGRWWLTCTDREKGGDANLYVWYASSVFGLWHPHPLNPVKTDVRSARPGGTPFEYQGHLYRPSQDCSRTGGGRIVVNRVERLTPTEFEEKPVAVIGPYSDTPYKEGLHTLAAAGGYTLIDGKAFRFIPSGLLSNLRMAIKRIRLF